MGGEEHLTYVALTDEKFVLALADEQGTFKTAIPKDLQNRKTGKKFGETIGAYGGGAIASELPISGPSVVSTGESIGKKTVGSLSEKVVKSYQVVRDKVTGTGRHGNGIDIAKQRRQQQALSMEELESVLEHLDLGDLEAIETQLLDLDSEA